MIGVVDQTVARTALIEANVPILWTTPGEILFANKECAKLFGYKMKEIMEKKPSDLLLNAEDQLNSTQFYEIIAEKKKIVKEFYGIKKNKTVFPFEASSTFIQTNGSGVVTIHMRDLTKRKKMERRASRFRMFAQIAREGIIIHKDGIIQDVNNALLHLFDYTRDELVGKHYDTIISRKDIDSLIEKLEHGNEQEIEVQGVTKKGEKLVLKIVSFDPPGRTGILAFYDVTEQKHNELVMKDSRSNLLEALEGAKEGIWTWDFNTDMIECNTNCLEIFKLSDDENPISEEKLSAIIDPADYVELKKKTKMLRKGEEQSYTTVYKIKNEGESVWVQTRVSVSAYDNSYKPTKLTGIVIDVSNLKQTELELTMAKNKAEQVSRFKSEFLSQMSHEIRTPLNIMLNFATLIEDEVKDIIIDDEIRECVRGMKNASNRITRTIESMILMSELQTGTYDFKAQYIWLYIDVLQKAYNEFKNMAAEKGIEFFLINETENAIIKGDMFSVQMIFSHLIDNAIKYTPNGGEVGIFLTQQNGLYAISVVDNGIGIDQAFQKDLFLPFSQEEQGYTRGYDGNGLGLALVHSFCKLNDAFIKVDSEKGSGTRITVEFPQAE